MRTFTVISCALLVAGCALSTAALDSDDVQREKEAVQLFFDELREKAPESDRQRLDPFLDRLSEIALSTIEDTSLSPGARSKKQFVAVLDVLEEMTRSDENGDRGFKEEFLSVIDETRTIVREQPDDEPPRREAFQNALLRIYELARVRGTLDQDLNRFLSLLESYVGQLA